MYVYGTCTALLNVWLGLRKCGSVRLCVVGSAVEV